MILRPCLHCGHKVGCERRQTMLARLRGSGVTVASFRCDERLRGYDAGQRVSLVIKGVPAGQTWDGDDVFEDVEFAGTIVGPAKKERKVVVWLDRPLDGDGDGGKLRPAVRMHPDRLTLLGSTVAVCASFWCGRPITAEPDESSGGCDDKAHRAARQARERALRTLPERCDAREPEPMLVLDGPKGRMPTYESSKTWARDPRNLGPEVPF